MRTTSRNALALLVIALSLPILAGCVTTTDSSAGIRVYCDNADPITWSDKDTDETIRQAKANNAVWKELCGKKQTKGT